MSISTTTPVIGGNIPSHSSLRHPDFLYGVATASYQIEGAVHEDGRIPSIWDTFCAVPNAVKNGDDGSIACDHYHLWKQDIALMQSLGIDAYRFSIAWPRVMDEQGIINQKGLDFYRNIIDRLLEENIAPVCTLYHWDLPQHLQDKGGWANRETAYKFAEYAEVITRTFGNTISMYATLNEPFCSAILGYERGVHAPGIKDVRIARQAAHHLLLAHGLAIPIMKQHAPKAAHGIALSIVPSIPYTTNPQDTFLAFHQNSYTNHWFLAPLFTGKYPEFLWKQEKAYRPLVLAGDMDIISTTIDFIGVNYYTRRLITASTDGAKEVRLPQAEYTQMGWEVYPEGLTNILVEMNNQYTLPPIYITENGMAYADTLTDNGTVTDIDRIRYYDAHLTAVHNAIEQNVDVRGYFAWSFMDNFEWSEGYEKRFGMVYVDYNTQQRIKKASAFAYERFITNRTKSSLRS